LLGFPDLEKNKKPPTFDVMFSGSPNKNITFLLCFRVVQRNT